MAVREAKVVACAFAVLSWCTYTTAVTDAQALRAWVPEQIGGAKEWHLDVIDIECFLKVACMYGPCDLQEQRTTFALPKVWAAHHGLHLVHLEHRPHECGADVRKSHT